MKIGFIGQGYVGKSYADNFEARGFAVARYSLDPEYSGNKEAIKTCDVVYIAVPTATTPEGPDFSIVDVSLSLLKPGAIAVIKSTIIPGTTNLLQSKHKKLVVLHSPEFLTSSQARKDVDTPTRNIIGMPVNSEEYKKSARLVLDQLPKAKFETICSSLESEFVKYAVNTFYYTKVVYMNALYDLANKVGVDWGHVKPMLAADPWTGPMHIETLHKTGRGAGGHCLIKDFAAFKKYFEANLPGPSKSADLLEAIEKKNLELLRDSGKDPEILKVVYNI